MGKKWKVKEIKGQALQECRNGGAKLTEDYKTFCGCLNNRATIPFWTWNSKEHSPEVVDLWDTKRLVISLATLHIDC
jgi:hypothetical protein